MTDAVDESAARGFRLPHEKPDNWDPVEIVYTRYTKDAAGNTVADPGSFVVCHKTIETFVEDLRNGKPLPRVCYNRKRHADDRSPGGPTDIYVGSMSYVVIELDPSLDWRFRKARPGVTTRRNYGNTNWGLQHVMPDGALRGNEGPDRDDCRIVYFGVIKREDVERQEFRLDVVSGKQFSDPVPIDPDIPNDGGKFPLTDRTPCRGTQEGAPHCRP